MFTHSLTSGMNFIVSCFMFISFFAVKSISMPLHHPVVPVTISKATYVNNSFQAKVLETKNGKEISQWVVKTSYIGGIICLIPLPASVTFPMKMAILALIMSSLVVESGSSKLTDGIKDSGKSVEKGLDTIGKGLDTVGKGLDTIGFGIAFGLTMMSAASVFAHRQTNSNSV